ncbi:unnamed protein product [Amoebophrya sp. A25]|nr:unnamed protein product [Amoebophrya sp. A25]|eukprot:GSA25T00024216001.1
MFRPRLISGYAIPQNGNEKADLTSSTGGSSSTTSSTNTYYARFVRRCLPRQWQDSLELRVVEDNFLPPERIFGECFLGARKSVWDGLLSATRSPPIRRELGQFFRAQIWLLAIVLTVSFVLVVSPIAVFGAILHIFHFEQRARAVWTTGWAAERFVLELVLQIGPFVHLLLIRYLLFRKLDSCFFVALRDLLHRCNGGKRMLFFQPKATSGGIFEQENQYQVVQQGQQDEQRQHLQLQGSSAIAIGTSGPQGRSRGGGQHHSGSFDLEQVTPTTEESFVPINNVEDFVDSFENITPVSKTVDAMAFRLCRNLFGAVLLILFYLLGNIGGAASAASASSAAGSSNISTIRVEAITSVLQRINIFDTQFVRFYAYPAFQFFVIYDKLGVRRAFYAGLLTFFMPSMRPALLRLLSYFIAVSALCREVLDPAIARLRELADRNFVIFYDGTSGRLEIASESDYTNWIRTGRFYARTGRFVNTGSKGTTSAQSGGGGVNYSMNDHQHQMNMLDLHVAGRAEFLSAGARSRTGSHGSSFAGEQDNGDPTFSSSPPYDPSTAGSTSPFQHQGGCTRGTISTSRDKPSRAGASSIGSRTVFLVKTTASLARDFALSQIRNTVFGFKDYVTARFFGTSRGGTTRNHLGGFGLHQLGVDQSKEDELKIVQRNLRNWSETRAQHEPELLGFGLPLILLIAFVPGFGAPLGWFLAQSAAPALFIRIYVLNLLVLQQAIDTHKRGGGQLRTNSTSL